MRKFFSYLRICFSARTCKYFQYLLVCVLSQVTRVFENKLSIIRTQKRFSAHIFLSRKTLKYLYNVSPVISCGKVNDFQSYTY
jgi:hypothetical protein